MISFLENAAPKHTTHSNCGQGGHAEQLENAFKAIAHKPKKVTAPSVILDKVPVNPMTAPLTATNKTAGVHVY